MEKHHRKAQKDDEIKSARDFKDIVENKPEEVKEETIVKYAQKIAKEARKVSYSQLRQVYGIIKNALANKENFDRKKLILAKPKIAYRKRNLHKDIVDLYLSFIDRVYAKNINDKYLVEFTEALIAYRKYYEKERS